MKVLFDCHVPFMLAHGGMQIQIEQTKAGLEAVGVEVEYLRWWDDRQTGNILHHFGRMPAGQIELARQKGITVVMAELLTGAGSRSSGQLQRQRMIRRVIERFAPRQFIAAFKWDAYRLADACVAGTPWEAHLMTYLFGAPPARVHVVPNGVETIFLNSPPAVRGDWLVCTATLTGRKRVLELVEAAVSAQTPLWIIGKAYSEADSYAQRFLQLAQQYSPLIRFEGPINDRATLAKIYREARGFVLLSTMETRSLSAEEAAACECPLLLSDLPWARTVFGERATYCPITSTGGTATVLRRFYDDAPTLPIPEKPLTRNEVGKQLKQLYSALLKPGDAGR
jgi:glycosyltransferase involved in cell wall biosynthesis